MPPIRIIVLLLLLALGTPATAQDSVQQLGPADAGTSPDVITPPGPPPPCGTQPITIARMPWPSAALLAAIHARLLKLNYHCDVQLVSGDLAATGSSMGATGQPAVAPELWVTRIPDIWNAAMKGKKVRQAGSTYQTPEVEGWYVPDYAVQTWPEVTSLDGLKAHAADFGNGTGRGIFLSCPADWACSVINRNLVNAFGLGGSFDIVTPANRLDMDRRIAEAVGRRQPILFYYWQPNAVLAQFGFSPVKLPGYDHDAFQCAGRRNCVDPKPTGFAPDPVVIAVADWVYTDAPEIAAYFQRAHMPFAEMDRLLLALGETGATVESVADRFVAERAEVWRPWLGPQPDVLPSTGDR
ncbi:MAG TPA: glycine betaine ABC transporter substrate-binding protein [Alphaproteobacteria bacterium]|nr:glycine betaine ABC transporter substrate-binding protein [Alphaproteobacteria bacterium]